MTKEAYPALFHYIQKALKDVSYPSDMETILKTAGDIPVNTDWNTAVPLKELISTLPEDSSFSCACDFYCKLIASWG